MCLAHLGVNACVACLFDNRPFDCLEAVSQIDPKRRIPPASDILYEPGKIEATSCPRRNTYKRQVYVLWHLRITFNCPVLPCCETEDHVPPSKITVIVIWTGEQRSFPSPSWPQASFDSLSQQSFPSPSQRTSSASTCIWDFLHLNLLFTVWSVIIHPYHVIRVCPSRSGFLFHSQLI